jgi:hypothetical protein
MNYLWKTNREGESPKIAMISSLHICMVGHSFQQIKLEMKR